MPRQRVLSSYPTEVFWALIKPIVKKELPMRLVPMEKGRAFSLRGELYAWRRACENEPGAALERGVEVDLLREFWLQVGDNGLTVAHVGESGTGKLLREYLNREGIAVPPPLSLQDEISRKAAGALAALRAQGLLDKGEGDGN